MHETNENELEEQKPIKKKPKKRFQKKKKGSKIGKMILYLFFGLVISFVMAKYNIKIKDVINKVLKRKEKIVEKPKEEVEIPLVKVYQVTKSDFEDTLPVIGTVKGIKEVDMRFETNGTLLELPFREGDLVSQGEMVAKLKPIEFKLKVDYQKANYEAAQAAFLGASKKLANAEKMFNLGAILISKLDEAILEADNAGAKMKSAKVELESAKHELTKTILKSNVPGVIGVIHMQEGEFVTNSEKVITVIDITMVHVELGIIEKDIDKVALGLTAIVKVDAYSDMEFKGVITNILPVVEGKSRTLTARVEIDNTETLLLPGMFTRADIAVFEAKDAIMIPVTALNKTAEGYSVNVTDADNIIEARPIKVGYITTEYVQVIQGLEVDEFIVTEAHAELKPGDKVQVMEIQEGLTN